MGDASLSPMTRKVYDDLLKELTRQRDRSEKSWAEAHGFLIELASIVANDWLHTQKLAGVRQETLRLDALYEIVRERVTQLHAQSKKQSGSGGASGNLESQIAALSGENEKLKRENKQLKLDNQFLSEATVRLEKQLEAPRNVPKTSASAPVEDGQFEQAFAAFQDAKDFNAHKLIVMICGRDGMALNPDIRRALSESFGYKDASKSAYDAIKAARTVGLIEGQTSTESGSGRPPEKLWLSEFGRYAYTRLTGEKPRENDYIKEHKSDGQVVLVLKAQKFLERMGYSIQPSVEIKQNQHRFLPDITASKDGKQIYVEVERATTKGNQDTDAKWRNYHHFSNGEMYIFCQNKAAVKKVIPSLNLALGSQTTQSKIYICNMDIAEAIFADLGHVWMSISQQGKIQKFGEKYDKSKPVRAHQ